MDSPARLFDQPLLRARQRRALALGPATFLLERVSEELADRLGAVVRRFDRAVDLGTPGDALRRALAGHPNAPATTIAVHPLVGVLRDTTVAVAADLDMLPFRDGALDLIVSALALQWVDDLPGALAQIRRALRPDGLFLAAMLGGETLTELRQAFAEAEEATVGGASPRVVPFADVRALGLLLQRAGFALPVSDRERLTVRYDTAFALFDDLRRMGAANPLTARSRVPLRRGTLMRVAEAYTRRFSDADGRVRATFDVVWLSGWAPHASQQRPLRPGAAATRLATALNTEERPAGEKAGQ